MKKFLHLFLTLVTLSGCFKTSEEARLSALEDECSTDRYYKLLDRRFATCAKTGLSDSLVSSCFSQFSSAFSRIQGACRELASMKIREIELGFVSEKIEGLSSTEGLDTFNRDSLSSFSSVLKLWNTKAKDIINYSESTASIDDSEAIVLKLFEKISSIDSLTNSNLENYVEVLSEIQNSGIKNFEIQINLQNKILGSLSEKLDSLTKIVDLSCQLSSCKSNKPSLYNVVSELSRIHTDPQGVTLSPQNNKIIEVLRSSMASILGEINHKIQETSPFNNLEACLEDKGLDSLSLSSDIRRMIVSLKAFKQYSTNMDTYGNFSGATSHVIDSGLDQQVVSEMVGLVDQIAGNLDLEGEKYQSNKSRLLELIKGRISGDAIQESLKYTLEQKYQDLEQKLTEIDANKQSLVEDRQSFSRYQQQLAELKDSEKIKLFSEKLIPGEESIFQVSSNQAKYDHTGNLDLTLGGLSISNTISLKKGEILNLTVKGSWAPICALKTSQYSDAASSNLKLGPEGFTIVNGQGDSKVVANSTSKTRQSTNSIGRNQSRCTRESVTGTLGGLLTGETGNLSTKIGISASKSFDNSSCMNTSTSISDIFSRTDTETDSQFNNNTANFQSGISLKDTPFPKFPAGSLLAFVVPKTATSYKNATDVMVVERNTTLLSKFDSEVHFVVNDCIDRSELSNSKLTVQTQTLINGSTSVNAMLENMIPAISFIEQEGEKIINEGGDISSRVQSLRSQAIAEFTMSEGSVMSFYTIDSIQSVFNSWLDNEVVKIERKARIKGLERSLRQDLLEIADLENRYRSENKKNLITAELISNTVDNLDLAVLSSSLQKLTKIVTERIYPMIKIHYPKGLSNIDIEHEKIDQISLDSTPVEIASIVATLVDSLNNIVKLETLGNLINKEERFVFLRFTGSGNACNPEIELCEDDTFAPKADESRSRTIWDAITGSNSVDGTLTVKVGPDDLYHPDAEYSKKLFCRESLPIIKNFQVFFVLDANEVSGDLNRYRGYELQTTLGTEMLLPYSNGPVNLSLSNPLVGVATVPVGLVTDANLFAMEQEMRSSQGGHLKGLSPFTNYSFSGQIQSLLRQLNENAPAIKEIVFAYVLTTDDSSGPESQRWIANCQ